jgi:flagellar protein FliO/FliZ
MLIRRITGFLLSLLSPASFALPADALKPPSRAVASADIVQWSLGLLVVLGIFFLCIWVVGKLGRMNAAGADKMRVVGGLSLGIREKIILLQVGKKQLVLGVTPGRIQTLHVLEGDDCLAGGDTGNSSGKSLFAQKLMQAIKSRPDA